MGEKQVKIEVLGREYSISFPNVGQFYKIETLKQSLSRGCYNTMITSPSPMAQDALDMIDIESTLVVLCPDLISDLKVKNFSELDIRDYKQIRDAYFKSVAPFFEEITNLLRGKDDE